MRSVILTVLSLIASVAFSQVTYNHKVDGDLFPGIDFRSNYLKDGMFEKSLSVGVSDPSGIASLVDGGAPVGSDRYLQITSTAGSQVVRIKGRGLRYTTYGLNCEAHWRYTGSGDSNFKFNVTDPNNSNASVGATYTILSNDSTSLWHIGTIYFPCGTSAHTYDITVTSLATASTIEIDNAYLGEALLGTSTPDTVWQDAGPMTVDAITTSPVKGTATEHTWWRRNGPNVDIRYEYAQTALGSATSGSGDFRWTIPSSIGCTIDTSKVTAYATSANNVPITNSVGHVFVSNGTPVNGHGIVVVYDSTRVRFYADNASNGLTAVSSTWFAYGGAGSVYHNAYFSVPCSGWTPQTAIQTQNSNTDETDGGANVITGTTTNPTKGTTSVDHFWWRKDNGRLIGRIEFNSTVAGTAGSGDYLWSFAASGCIADTSKVTPYTTISGVSGTTLLNTIGNVAGGVGGSSAGTGNVSLYDSTHVRFHLTNTSTAGYNAQSSAWYQLSQLTSITARFEVPCSNWPNAQNAPQLVNSVVSDRNGVTFTASGLFGGSGSCTITSQSGTTFSGCTRSAVGVYAITFLAGAFSTAPVCTGNTSGSVALFGISTAATTSGITVTTNTPGTGNTDNNFVLRCEGQH